MGLFEIVAEMCGDNWALPLPISNWPKLSEHGFDFQRLETQSRSMSDLEAETLAVGEVTEIQEIIKKYNCHELNKFLNQVFDGQIEGVMP